MGRWERGGGGEEVKRAKASAWQGGDRVGAGVRGEGEGEDMVCDSSAGGVRNARGDCGGDAREEGPGSLLSTA